MKPSDLLSVEALKMAAAEGKSMADMMVEAVIMAAAEPGMSKNNATFSRYRRDFMQVAVEAMKREKGDGSEISSAITALLMALAILMAHSDNTEKTLALLTDHLRSEVAIIRPLILKLAAVGVPLGVPLNQLGLDPAGTPGP